MKIHICISTHMYTYIYVYIHMYQYIYIYMYIYICIHIYVHVGRIEEPSSCPSCQALAGMELIHNRCLFSDKQLIRIQETPDEIPEGETPTSVSIYIYIYIYIYMCICICINTNMYLRIYIYVYIYRYTCRWLSLPLNIQWTQSSRCLYILALTL
jgi:hypothetical protein